MAKRKQRNFYGKAWTVEWSTGVAGMPLVYVTGQSAATLCVQESLADDGLFIDKPEIWFSTVPPYLRRIVQRRLGGPS